MKSIFNVNELKTITSTNENVWLLLFKKGSAQSDCAYDGFTSEKINAKNAVLCYADVNVVRNIHPEYNVKSVPSLLYFERGKLKNVLKGCYKPEQLNAIINKKTFIASGNVEEKIQKNVTVYTTPTCTWCTTIKRHLQENKIRYREIDVSADQKAAEEMVRKSGQQGVPQTDINGQIIVGFDKTRIDTLLGINQ